MRIRLDVMRSCQSQNERSYFYAGPGKGAVATAWKQGAWAELASRLSSGVHYSIALLDLVKAFDRIPYWFLLEQALECGFDVCLLVFSIAAYRLARVFGVDGVFSCKMWASRGITAGPVVATIEMRLVMIGALDRVVAAGLHVRLTCFVDDVSIEAAGSHKFVATNLVEATQIFTEGLEGAEMSFSDTKNMIAASSSALLKEVVPKLARLKVKGSKRITSLGSPLALEFAGMPATPRSA